MRLSLELAEAIPPELDPYQTFALSPDGMRLAHVGKREGKYQLFLRALGQTESTPIPGTEGGFGPFFSPDGQWIGFYSGGVLRRVAMGGGSPVIIGGAADDPLGASWGDDGAIVYARRFYEGLSRIPAVGGKAEALTKLDWPSGERNHFWPEFLPGGEAALISVCCDGGVGDSRIDALSLKTGERKTLIKGATRARYLPTGHLVYARGGVLRVVPFDPARLELRGEPIKLLERVAVNPVTGAAHYAVSRDGLLVYLPEQPRRADHRLVWVDRQGQAAPLVEKPRDYWTPRLAPDGRRLAFAAPVQGLDLWIHELASGALKRLTFEKTNLAPLWTPDGRRIVFSSDRAGAQMNLYWKAADGSDDAERLTRSANTPFPGSWSPDGKLLAYAEIDPESRWDIWLLNLSEPASARRPRALIKSPAGEAYPAISPDGRRFVMMKTDANPTQTRLEIVVNWFTELKRLTTTTNP